jgi:VWFA-related protein
MPVLRVRKVERAAAGSPTRQPRWAAPLAAGVVVCAASVVLAQQQQQAPPPQPPQQQPPPPIEQPTFRTRVNIVRVDVSVFDRDDRALEGLQPADFVVKEDGVPQTVDTVQFIRLTGQTPSELRESTAIRSAEHAAVEGAREDVRLFVLFLDDYHVDKSPTIMIPLKRTLRAFVEKLGPYDLVAVMDPLTPLTHVEFSRDRQKLTETVNKFEGRRGELFPVRSAAEEAQQSQRNIWELRAGVTLDALNAIVTKLGGMREGRKSVLFVSQGPPMSLRSINWPRMEDVVQSANRSYVTIHTLDPRPLGASEFGGNMVLRRFSDETGGRAIFNTNDHAQHLDEVIEDASAYYLIGYSPSRGDVADGKFHKIEVEVKRPRVRVTARRGYWSPRSSELNAPPVEPVKAEVITALSELVEPKTGSTAEVWVGYTRGSAPSTDVTVAWEPTSRMGVTSAARVDVEHLNGDGSVNGSPQSILRSGLAGAAMSARPTAARFALAPGKTILRFTSYDAAGEVLDRWTHDIAVPDLASPTLALATPRFLLARSAFELRALQTAKDATPAASRRLRKTDRLLVELEAYSSASAELSVELLNQKGLSLVTLPVPAPAAGGKSRLEIPLQLLAPSTYVLKVTAKTADKQVEQHAPFRIVP